MISPLSVIYGCYVAPTGFRTRIDLIRSLLVDALETPGDWLVFDRDVDEKKLKKNNSSTELIIPRTRSVFNLLKHLCKLRLKKLPDSLTGPYNLLVAHSFNSLFPAAAIKIKYKLPLIVDVHGIWLDEVVSQSENKMGKSMLKAIEKKMLNQADGYIFVSSVLRDVLFQRYPEIADKPSVIVPNAIISDDFTAGRTSRQELRARWGWENCHIIVHSGIYAPWVDVEGITNLMTLCRDQIPDVRFLFLSNDTKPWENIVRGNGLESVTKCFSLPHSAVPDYLSASDIGLVARVNSIINKVASPTKIAEYLALGMPVMMTPGIGDYDRDVENNYLGIVTSLDLAKDEAESVIKKLISFDRNSIRAWTGLHLDIKMYEGEMKTLIEKVRK